MQELRLRREGNRILLIHNDRLVAFLDARQALTVGRSLVSLGKEAEELDHVDQIVFDQALLTRLGIPVGLTDTPALRARAWHEAQWNRNLRRYLPNRDSQLQPRIPQIYGRTRKA